MSVRAKFSVQGITRTATTIYRDGQPVATEMQTIRLTPVYGSGDPEHENTKFWNATPTGTIELGCVNADAANEFDLGVEFYVDFTRAT